MVQAIHSEFEIRVSPYSSQLLVLQSSYILHVHTLKPTQRYNSYFQTLTYFLKTQGKNNHYIYSVTICQAFPFISDASSFLLFEFASAILVVKNLLTVYSLNFPSHLEASLFCLLFLKFIFFWI